MKGYPTLLLNWRDRLPVNSNNVRSYIQEEDKIFKVESPVSGTFYRKPSPEDSPYVEVGQEVKAGDVLCLVESMKVFTEVTTEKNGIVRKILVENEDPVLENQPLLEIEAL